MIQTWVVILYNILNLVNNDTDILSDPKIESEFRKNSFGHATQIFF